MATEDSLPSDLSPSAPEPAPELADWWVWGVRKVAGVVAELLMIARGFLVLLIVLKAISWALTRDSGELYQAIAAVAGFIGAWVGALLLGHFSWERDSPDPERWLARRPRR